MKPYLKVLRHLAKAEANLVLADQALAPGSDLDSVSAPLHTAMVYLELSIEALKASHEKPRARRKPAELSRD